MGESGGEEAKETPKPKVDAYGRLKGVTLVKPIVYGNTARYLSRKLENGHTHSWTVFLRPYRAEEAERWIRKVSFKLHDSYTQQTRVVEEPPWEVTETGWGEFEAIIKVYFVDPNEKPVTAFHLLKLFQADPQCIAGQKNVVSEVYDEIIFQEPSAFLHKRLKDTEGRGVKAGHHTDFVEKKKRTLELLATARATVNEEIQEMEDACSLLVQDLRSALKEGRTLVESMTERTRALEDGGDEEPSAPPTPLPDDSAHGMEM